MTTSSPDSISNGDMFQNALYVGTNIQNILYGMELLLYFKTIYIILTHKGRSRKSATFYVLFSSAMVFFLTIWAATQARMGQEMWLLNPGFPGGPITYWQVHISDWYMDWATTAGILLQLMTDALMIHRCRIVWKSYRVIIIPVILWLASLALGVLFDWTSSMPGGDFFTGISCRLGSAYYSISVFLNITLTGMICYRFVQYGWRAQKDFGREYASFYFILTTITIESVLPYTVSGIAFLVVFGLSSPMAIAFISVYVPMMCISPQMLILRLIVGRAWNNDTSKPPDSTILFNHGNLSGSENLENTETGVHLQTPPRVYIPDGYHQV